MEMMRRATPKVLKSREAAEQLHCEAATHPCNSTRAAAARGGPNGYPAKDDEDVEVEQRAEPVDTGGVARMHLVAGEN